MSVAALSPPALFCLFSFLFALPSPPLPTCLFRSTPSARIPPVLSFFLRLFARALSRSARGRAQHPSSSFHLFADSLSWGTVLLWSFAGGRWRLDVDCLFLFFPPSGRTAVRAALQVRKKKGTQNLRHRRRQGGRRRDRRGRQRGTPEQGRKEAAAPRWKQKVALKGRQRRGGVHRGRASCARAGKVQPPNKGSQSRAGTPRPRGKKKERRRIGEKRGDACHESGDRELEKRERDTKGKRDK